MEEDPAVLTPQGQELRSAEGDSLQGDLVLLEVHPKPMHLVPQLIQHLLQLDLQFQLLNCRMKKNHFKFGKSAYLARKQHLIMNLSAVNTQL